MKNKFLNIIYEDKDIIVLNKKAGLLTISTDKDKEHNLYHYVREYLNKKKQKVFIVHRLDKDTSGIIVFAKNIETKEKLQYYFEKRNVIRKYEAVIKEKIDLNKEYKIVQYLYLDQKSKMVYLTKDRNKGKKAITFLKSHNYLNENTVLDIEIKTGRKNQIRIAISSLGFTLLGDKKYGIDKTKKMHLNSYYLEFPNDSGLKQNKFEIKTIWLQ